jgi:hypothetical protein
MPYLERTINELFLCKNSSTLQMEEMVAMKQEGTPYRGCYLNNINNIASTGIF